MAADPLLPLDLKLVTARASLEPVSTAILAAMGARRLSYRGAAAELGIDAPTLTRIVNGRFVPTEAEWKILRRFIHDTPLI